MPSFKIPPIDTLRCLLFKKFQQEQTEETEELRTLPRRVCFLFDFKTFDLKTFKLPSSPGSSLPEN